MLLDSLRRPNGIAVLPGEETLIIANSDPITPFWYAYDLDEQGGLTNGRIFFDSSLASKGDKGLPDGLKVDKDGNVFATGAGGVWVFNKEGDFLGRIKISAITSNCSLSREDQTLFITADDHVVKVDLR